MDSLEKNRIGDTVRIRRPPRIVTDELGRNSWMGGVDECELELEPAVGTNPYDSTDTRHWRLPSL